MPFAYYNRLSAGHKTIYRRSDEVPALVLPAPGELQSAVTELRLALERDDRRALEAAADRLLRGLTRQLDVPLLQVAVLAVRPSAGWGELHGLYTREEGRAARIQLWMRTARHKRVVAFRTFLRTLLHELGHHLDYEYLRLAESFHTEGFFRRESSLFHQLVSELARDQDSVSPRPGRK
jgi:hypothetical protein